MKKILGILSVLLAAAMLVGCGVTKELNEEEEARISEYAATLLLKYDANYKNLLWETEEEEAVEAVPSKEEKEESEKKDETVSGSAVAAENTEKEAEEVSQGIAEIFGLSGVEVQYSGYEFVKSFPANAEQGYSIQAGDGKKLLIIKLQVRNQTSEAVAVDILSGMPSFRIHFNEEEIVAKMTITLEDFSTMIESVPAGAAVEKVLVGEVPESFSEQMEKLSLTTRFNGTTSVTTFAP